MNSRMRLRLFCRVWNEIQILVYPTSIFKSSYRNTLEHTWRADMYNLIYWIPSKSDEFLSTRNLVRFFKLQLSKLLTKLTLTGAARSQRNQNRGLFYSCVSPRAYQWNARSTGKIHLGNHIENRILSNFILFFRNSLKPLVKFIPVFVL